MTFPKKALAPKMIAVALAAAMALAALAGCAQAGTAANQQQGENRQYMSQVNQVMDDLETQLASFTDAVSRDDVVGMQTQAQNALATLDDLESIEAPESLADVHQNYLEGAASLREALDDYVALYTEISSASDEAPFDWGTYEARLAQIQEKYDAGIEKMRDGDALAAGKEGAGDQQGQQDQQADGGQAAEGQQADGGQQSAEGQQE